MWTRKITKIGHLRCCCQSILLAKYAPTLAINPARFIVFGLERVCQLGAPTLHKPDAICPTPRLLRNTFAMLRFYNKRDDAQERREFGRCQQVVNLRLKCSNLDNAYDSVLEMLARLRKARVREPLPALTSWLICAYWKESEIASMHIGCDDWAYWMDIYFFDRSCIFVSTYMDIPSLMVMACNKSCLKWVLDTH